MTIDEIERMLTEKTPAELDFRRKEIISSAKGDWESLSTETLREFAFITSTLRRRNSGPPKRAATPKSKATIDDLL